MVTVVVWAAAVAVTAAPVSATTTAVLRRATAVVVTGDGGTCGGVALVTALCTGLIIVMAG